MSVSTQMKERVAAAVVDIDAYDVIGERVQIRLDNLE